MIWWPLITKYEFQPDWGQLTQLTNGLYIKYTVFASGTQQPQYKFDVYIGDNHYQITNHLPMSFPGSVESHIFHVLSITRKKKLITLTINGEARKYYLKTPSIWKVKKL